MSKNENHAKNNISVDKIISMTRTATPNTLRTHHVKFASTLSKTQQYREREKL